VFQPYERATGMPWLLHAYVASPPAAAVRQVCQAWHVCAYSLSGGFGLLRAYTNKTQSSFSYVLCCCNASSLPSSCVSPRPLAHTFSSCMLTACIQVNGPKRTKLQEAAPLEVYTATATRQYPMLSALLQVGRQSPASQKLWHQHQQHEGCSCYRQRLR
jgi:hypothetical protein